MQLLRSLGTNSIELFVGFWLHTASRTGEIQLNVRAAMSCTLDIQSYTYTFPGSAGV